MSASKQFATVQHGIWIDQQQIEAAGLQGELMIEVAAGQIRIVAAGNQPVDSGEGWDAFGQLGEAAKPGALADPSIHHDRYLHRRSRSESNRNSAGGNAWHHGGGLDRS